MIFDHHERCIFSGIFEDDFASPCPEVILNMTWTCKRVRHTCLDGLKWLLLLNDQNQVTVEQSRTIKEFRYIVNISYTLLGARLNVCIDRN